MQVNSELNSLEKISKELFIDHFPVNQELLLVFFERQNWTLELLSEVEKYSQRKKSKMFFLRSIEILNSEHFGSYVLRNSVVKNKLHIKDIGGVLKLEFSDGNVMLIIKPAIYQGHEIKWLTIIVSLNETYVKFTNLTEPFLKRKFVVPVRGKFEVGIEDRNNLVYHKLPPCDDPNIIIPQEKDVLKTIDNFFNHIEFHTSGKRKGMWVSLFYGPPGSGKSSYCNKIGDLYSSKSLVVFATHIGETVEHLKNCAKNNIRTITILEDADLSLINGNSSYLLNFLQGHLTPVNKKGAYLIITTNFHNSIESRVLRPGRINMKFYFGALTDEFALQCAQGYFREQYPEFDEIIKNGGYHKVIKISSNLTGAQIEQIYIITDHNLGSALKKELTLEAIQQAKESLIDHELRTAEKEKQNLTQGKGIGY